MFIRLLFWFVVFYVSFKFLIRVVLPLVLTTRNVRAKMRDMNDGMSGYKNNSQTTTRNTAESQKSETKTASKDDYIDFEEIK